MDLALWTLKDAHIGIFTALWLNLGAKPFRCEYCRENFVSFRLRHERFSFQRWTRMRRSEERSAVEEQPISPE